jgi:hypothetical protein
VARFVQIDPSAALEAPDGKERLVAWRARKVRHYIDSHIAHFRQAMGQTPAAWRRAELHDGIRFGGPRRLEVCMPVRAPPTEG